MENALPPNLINAIKTMMQIADREQIAIAVVALISDDGKKQDEWLICSNLEDRKYLPSFLQTAIEINNDPETDRHDRVFDADSGTEITNPKGTYH